MLDDERKLMLEIFGHLVSGKELEKYLDMEDEMRKQEYETRNDIINSTR